MLAKLGNVPIRRIEELVSGFARGYATPRVDVRGAVVDGDRILLVREKSDGLWALPGGFADVGLSAAQNVEKEILEEAGLKVSACRLYGVRHKASASYPPDVRDFHKMFFLCKALRWQRSTEVGDPRGALLRPGKIAAAIAWQDNRERRRIRICVCVRRRKTGVL